MPVYYDPSVMILGKVYQLLIIPYRMTFGYEYLAIGPVDVSFFVWDAMFIIDLVLQMRWGFFKVWNKHRDD